MDELCLLEGAPQKVSHSVANMILHRLDSLLFKTLEFMQVIPGTNDPHGARALFSLNNPAQFFGGKRLSQLQSNFGRYALTPSPIFNFRQLLELVTGSNVHGHLVLQKC